MEEMRTAMKPIQLIVNLPFSYWQRRDGDTLAPLQKPDERTLAAYISSLMREIRSLGADLEDCEVAAVHFSGGYMNLLTADEFTEMIACIRRSFSFRADMQVSGVVFPGGLDMALISAYKNVGVAPLMLEVPSLHARECERLRLPNTLQALDKTAFLLQNFGVSDFGLRLPIGIEGRSETYWRFILGQIFHYQPQHVSFFPQNGEPIQEDPAFETIKGELVRAGFTEVAKNFLTMAKVPPRLAAGSSEYAGVGLGAVSVLDGYKTQNTADMRSYVMGSADYRQLIVSAEEIE